MIIIHEQFITGGSDISFHIRTVKDTQHMEHTKHHVMTQVTIENKFKKSLL